MACMSQERNIAKSAEKREHGKAECITYENIKTHQKRLKTRTTALNIVGKTSNIGGQLELQKEKLQQKTE